MGYFWLGVLPEPGRTLKLGIAVHVQTHSWRSVWLLIQSRWIPCRIESLCPCDSIHHLFGLL